MNRDDTYPRFNDLQRYMQATGELPSMFFNVLPSIQASWFQRFAPQTDRYISLELQDVWGSVLSAETLGSLTTSSHWIEKEVALRLLLRVPLISVPQPSGL